MGSAAPLPGVLVFYSRTDGQVIGLEGRFNGFSTLGMIRNFRAPLAANWPIVVTGDNLSRAYSLMADKTTAQ
jgi:hypothetical protein